MPVDNKKLLPKDNNENEETREIIINSNCQISPRELINKILMNYDNILIKETCYGLIIQADKVGLS